ncbi:MAG TPA: AMP-binding protein, partial [Paracoccaceae bacterium]|nr:AMP-binding protein [Paracoccaceae bacterium]
MTAENVAQRWYAKGYWRRETLWQSLEAAAAKAGSHAAILDKEGELSLGDFLLRARRIAGALGQTGLVAGDLVLVQSRNRIDAYAALVACFAGGYVAAPVPPMFSARQVTEIVAAAGVRALVLFDSDIDGVTRGLAEQGSPMPLVFVPDA